MGEAISALHTCGFLHAADHRIETAQETGFKPPVIEPSRLQTRFFER
jgi:hypothetical protein